MARDEDDLETGESPEIKVPDPRENPSLVGHEAAEAVLLRAFLANRLPSGLLITGPHGIGKATLAFRFARFLLAQAAERSGGGLFVPAAPTTLAVPAEHPVFRRIAAGGHADLLTIERGIDPKRKRERSEIVIEDARKVAGFLHLTPAEGGWRIVIVDIADEMNRSAANTLLKILEEPPARAVLILLSDNPGRLLPTIRSRCRRLALRPLSNERVDALIARYRPDLTEAERSQLVKLAKGSIGRALELQEVKGLAIKDSIEALLAGLPKLDGAALQDLADEVSRWNSEGTFSVLAELLPETLAEKIAAAARPESRSDPPLSTLLRRRGLDRWVEVWEKIIHLFAQADAINLDRKQVVLNAFFALEEAAR